MKTLYAEFTAARLDEFPAIYFPPFSAEEDSYKDWASSYHFNHFYFFLLSGEMMEIY